MNLIDSNHSQVLARAMGAYALRQKVTAANIANADTPGYKRREVSFENELQNAQQSAGTAGMKNVTPTLIETDENVMLEEEMIEMADTQIRVQMVTRSLRHHFSLLKKGITGINR
ncbi:MAG: flagellar basal body rod protein FlgB [Balneolaceae bacterium]|nr:flagellar basal body rod protein FlgB [Balneolaceae bacterium]